MLAPKIFRYFFKMIITPAISVITAKTTNTKIVSIRNASRLQPINLRSELIRDTKRRNLRFDLQLRIDESRDPTRKTQIE
jgi:hypothetical protein